MKDDILLSVEQLTHSFSPVRGFTVRAVAGACGIGVGTVYHYYPSKDMLIASIILEDWMRVLEKMDALTEADGFSEALEGLSDLLSAFRLSYDNVFSESRDSMIAPAFLQRHIMLRGQIASVLSHLCRRFDRAESNMALRCAAELILSATSEGWPTAELLPMLNVLLPARPSSDSRDETDGTT